MKMKFISNAFDFSTENKKFHHSDNTLMVSSLQLLVDTKNS
jgi:hypothetical protein